MNLTGTILCFPSLPALSEALGNFGFGEMLQVEPAPVATGEDSVIIAIAEIHPNADPNIALTSKLLQGAAAFAHLRPARTSAGFRGCGRPGAVVTTLPWQTRRKFHQQKIRLKKGSR